MGNFDPTRLPVLPPVPPLSAFSDAATGARHDLAALANAAAAPAGPEFDKLPVLPPAIGPADLSWFLTASNVQNFRNTPLAAQFNAPYYTPFDDANESGDDHDDHLPNGSRKSRLARKAELARASRRRKKFYVQNLETKVKTLTKTVEQLQQLKVPEANESVSVHEMLRKNVEEMLGCVGKNPKNGEPNDEDLGRSIKAYVAPLGARAGQAEAMLSRIQSSMNPNVYLKPQLWGLSSSAALDIDESRWGDKLTQTLGLSERQIALLAEHRGALKRLREQLHASEASLQDLRRQFEAQQRTIDQHTELIEAVLTPAQLAKYYLFEESQKESICSRV